MHSDGLFPWQLNLATAWSAKQGEESGGPFKMEPRKPYSDKDRCAAKRKRFAVLLDALRQEVAPEDLKKTISQPVLLSMAAEIITQAHDTSTENGSQGDDGDPKDEMGPWDGVELVGLALDKDGNIKYALPSSMRLIGVAAEDLIGRPVTALAHLSHVPVMRCAMVQAIDGPVTIKCLLTVWPQQPQGPGDTGSGSQPEEAMPAFAAPQCTYRQHTVTFKAVTSANSEPMFLVTAHQDEDPNMAVAVSQPWLALGNDRPLPLSFDGVAVHRLVDFNRAIRFTVGNSNGDFLGFGTALFLNNSFFNYAHPLDIPGNIQCYMILLGQFRRVDAASHVRSAYGKWVHLLAHMRICVNRQTGQPTHVFSHAQVKDPLGISHEVTSPAPGSGAYEEDVILYDHEQELVDLAERMVGNFREEYKERLGSLEEAEEQTILQDMRHWRSRMSPTQAKDRKQKPHQKMPTLTHIQHEPIMAASGFPINGIGNPVNPVNPVNPINPVIAALPTGLEVLDPETCDVILALCEAEATNPDRNEVSGDVLNLQVDSSGFLHLSGLGLDWAGGNMDRHDGGVHLAIGEIESAVGRTFSGSQVSQSTIEGVGSLSRANVIDWMEGVSQSFGESGEQVFLESTSSKWNEEDLAQIRRIVSDDLGFCGSSQWDRVSNRILGTNDINIIPINSTTINRNSTINGNKIINGSAPVNGSTDPNAAQVHIHTHFHTHTHTHKHKHKHITICQRSGDDIE